MLNSYKDINVVEGEVNDQENVLCGDSGSPEECPKNIGKHSFFLVLISQWR